MAVRPRRRLQQDADAAVRHGRCGIGSALAALALLALLGSTAGAAAAETLLGRVAGVADGDTLTLDVDGDRQRIRLHEIDTPEHDQPWSDQARGALARKVAGKYVRVTVAAVDDYGRTVGKVWLGSRDINRELVREGHAWVYRRYLQDESLLADEAAARAARRGLWRQADPVAPWQWRQAARSRAPQQGASALCDIKGNINRRGERIYHRPGDRHYRQTRIDPSRGERWFCSTAEAERAGWRSTR